MRLRGNGRLRRAGLGAVWVVLGVSGGCRQVVVLRVTEFQRPPESAPTPDRAVAMTRMIENLR